MQDLLDYMLAWQTARAAMLECRERGADDVNYYCRLQIEAEKKARAAYFRELHCVIIARVAGMG